MIHYLPLTEHFSQVADSHTHARASDWTNSGKLGTQFWEGVMTRAVPAHPVQIASIEVVLSYYLNSARLVLA